MLENHVISYYSETSSDLIPLENHVISYCFKIKKKYNISLRGLENHVPTLAALEPVILHCSKIAIGL